MKAIRLFPITTLALAALLLAACSGGSGTQSQFTVSVDDTFKLSPAMLQVKAGQPVVLTFKNAGSVEHGLAILKEPGAEIDHLMEEAHDEEDLHSELMLEVHEIAGGASATETFMAPAEPGDYTFACPIPGHAEAGEVGTLKVVP